MIGAKPVAEPQCRIAGDRALAGDDLAYTVRRHGDLSRKFSGRDAQFRQFVLQNAAPMHNSPEHDEVAFHQW